MKISAERADAFCQRPDSCVRIVLLYGPDEGLVRERAQTLVASVAGDPGDPFRVSELSCSGVAKDLARLGEEISALSLTGGRRVIRIRDAGDSLSRGLADLVEDWRGDSLVVLQAGVCDAKSSLRRFCESHALAAAVPCYLDEGAALEAVIRSHIVRSGFEVSRDAMACLLACLGGDRSVTRQELEKLILYVGAGGGTIIQADDVLACIGDASALAIDDFLFAVADGDIAGSQRLLDRLSGEGVVGVSLLRAAVRHFQRLHLVGGALASGYDRDRALGLLKPPVFWKLRARFLAQLARWSPTRTVRALDLLLEAEMNCKRTGMPEVEIVARVFLQLSRAARVRGA
ncbi:MULTISPECIES: DNA polymerase III subunit delta [unclassified Haematospirillum]|uniref:DNA polymerase III subunit delta n=1 Tax=unclassified Haematospirillum TaxID=2622088 RepID=UPI001439D02F|nr:MULTISPECIES: DNA polymerase III subunit delta [unclassified Haematospirillum]NKD55589.1 DNA polymerase III subunit delta [Haematospirillum sp. H4890]NKD75728.1 DNA polymerase III subunit delta [Haematospirillum sp. H4485]